MAGIFISSFTSEFLEQLSSVIQPIVAGEDVEEDVEKLSMNLAAFQTVLSDADQRQFLDGSVRRWVDKLEDFCYEADDLLDEWRTVILKSQIRKEEEKKVCFPMWSFGFSVQSQLRRDVAGKISKMNKKLGEIAYEKERNPIKIGVTEEEERITSFSTPFVDENEIHGRNKEKDDLLGKLWGKRRRSIDKKGHEIIPIVGMGGIGKTTLAQLAYNDDNVKAYFELRIWVHVGHPFDLIRIAKTIIEAITGCSPALFELENLLSRVYDSIRGKRFLLVLDDVWSEDWMQWEALEGSLKPGAAGSKIVVTTQKKSVSAMIGATTRMIVLKTLSDEDCQTIFEGLAFWDGDSKEDEQIKGLGKEIVKKCKGLPLVAKSLGRLMHFKREIEEWKAVLNHQLWELYDFRDSVFAPFWLSYYDLLPLEKLCLSYCSLFPSDYKIDKDDLIELWMSQGFFDADKNFEISKKCFDSLAMRSFFQDFENKFHGEITTCKMHGVIHDFLLFITRRSCFIWEVSGGNEGTNQENETTRHCTLLLKSGAEIPTSVYEKKKLRTLFVMRSEISAPLELNSLSKLVSLWTLCLSSCGIKELPGGIDKLIHLRYLNLSGNSKLQHLPYELCNLLNLQTLRLNGCTDLEELPDRMGRLVNLRHLYINGCNELKKLPVGIGRLAFLRKLDMFIVPCNDHDNKAMTRGDLSKFEDFRGYLCIHGIGNVEDAGDAKKLELNKIQSLAGLKLNFSQGTEPRRTDGELTELLEALQPHQSLTSLEIREYHGATLTFPHWMTLLTNLRRIAVNGFPNCEFLPPFGKLASLEVLSIENMEKVEKVGPEFLGLETGRDTTESESSSTTSFPMLKSLSFCGLNSWKQWSGIEDSSSLLITMPSLRLLEISDCKSLQTLPDFVQTIQVDRKIKDCPILKR